MGYYDFNCDGRLEIEMFAMPEGIVLEEPLYSSCSAGRGWWNRALPQIVSWRSNRFVDVSSEYPHFYADKVESLRRMIRRLEDPVSPPGGIDVEDIPEYTDSHKRLLRAVESWLAFSSD